jgi:hypothetical protein
VIVWTSSVEDTGEDRLGLAEQKDGTWAVTPNVITIPEEDSFGRINIDHAPNGEPVVSWLQVDDIATGRNLYTVNYLTRQNGVWGSREVVASGRYETGGMSGGDPALLFIQGVPTIFYDVLKTLTTDLAEYSLVVRRRNSPGNWSAAREILTCTRGGPSEPETNLAIPPFFEFLAFTLPANATLGLPERGLILARLKGGVLVAFQDASGAWNVRHTGPLPVEQYGYLTAALATDGAVRLIVGRPPDSAAVMQTGIATVAIEDLPALPSNCEPAPAPELDIEWIPGTGVNDREYARALSLVGNDAFLSQSTWNAGSGAMDLRVHARCDGQWSSEFIDRIPDIPGRGPMIDPNGNLFLVYSDSWLGDLYFATRTGNPCQ